MLFLKKQTQKSNKTNLPPKNLNKKDQPKNPKTQQAASSIQSQTVYI